MKKTIAYLVAAMFAVLAAQSVASAQSYPYGSTMFATAPLAETVTVRFYTPTNSKISPGANGQCPGAYDAVAGTCVPGYFDAAVLGNGLYFAYLEDIQNYPVNFGTVHYALWDVQQNAATASHAGYYFWAGKAVQNTDQADLAALNCTGGTPQAQTCIGQGNPTNVGSGIANTPVGTINPITGTGFRPIPVPLVSSSSTSTGDITLSWAAATVSGGDTATANYEVTGIKKATCTAPLVGEYAAGVTKAVTGATTVTFNTLTDFATAASAQGCYYFALKIVYPSASATAMKSLYYSANSQGVVFGGLAAAQVYGLDARVATRGNVSVTWRTSDEANLAGFYVARSADGVNFTRVSSLIAAKGTPSIYSYIDPAGRSPRGRATYRIESVDKAGKAQVFGPVAVNVGTTREPRERNNRGEQLRESETQRRTR